MALLWGLWAEPLWIIPSRTAPAKLPELEPLTFQQLVLKK